MHAIQFFALYVITSICVGHVGNSGDQFSIEIQHGGFFVGHGNMRSYVDEKIDFFDDLEADTWSLLWFDDFVEQLGYQKNDRLKFYWLLPGKTLADGLRIIAQDKDTNIMASIVTKVKNLVMYFDHDDIAGGINWDDIVTMKLRMGMMTFLRLFLMLLEMNRN